MFLMRNYVTSDNIHLFGLSFPHYNLVAKLLICGFIARFLIWGIYSIAYALVGTS